MEGIATAHKDYVHFAEPLLPIHTSRRWVDHVDPVITILIEVGKLADIPRLVVWLNVSRCRNEPDTNFITWYADKFVQGLCELVIRDAGRCEEKFHGFGQAR
jgi:hypothetical protein